MNAAPVAQCRDAVEEDLGVDIGLAKASSSLYTAWLQENGPPDADDVVPEV